MALTITTNVNSLSARRHAILLDSASARSLQRLSSGSRINNAADDAAGLAMAQRLTSRIGGTDQAKRNIVDATSMLQVADQAMAQVTESLQRLRTLAVQSGNNTLAASDRDALKQEASQILNQITQVGNQTMFNGQAVFAQDAGSIGGDPDRRAVIDGLKTGWLTSAEQLVKNYYGLTADGASLTVNLNTSDGAFNVLASVSGSVGGGSGKYNNLHLNIDMADFPAINRPDGGRAPMYADRVIAHEMVHAIMSRATDFQMPQWFKEGTAELIHGADERLAGAVGGSSAAAVANSVTTAGGWSYEGGYAASRYLHDKLKTLGVDGGIKGIMVYMSQNQSATFDQALNTVTGGAYADNDAFVTDFNANGGAFITTKMNLTNADTGAIGGLDADGGPVRTARTVVNDTSDRNADNPLEGLKAIFPTVNSQTATRGVQVQMGAASDDNLTVKLSAMNSVALGLGDLDLNGASIALLHIDQALDFVAQQRVVAGASLNRLDIATQGLSVEAENLTASRSRIVDTDFAAETTILTRNQILQQAASAILTQANSMPSAVLSLLRVG
jgi:flagellin